MTSNRFVRRPPCSVHAGTSRPVCVASHLVALAAGAVIVLLVRRSGLAHVDRTLRTHRERTVSLDRWPRPDVYRLTLDKLRNKEETQMPVCCPGGLATNIYFSPPYLACFWSVVHLFLKCALSKSQTLLRDLVQEHSASKEIGFFGKQMHLYRLPRARRDVNVPSGASKSLPVSPTAFPLNGMRCALVAKVDIMPREVNQHLV